MTLNLDNALREHFGFPSFRIGQREAISTTLSARDALVVMPTGSGKSLCYQLSALLLPHTTLVISPLIALMKDQVDALIARGKPATLINSTLSADEQHVRLNTLAQGAYKIVYVAPERLRNADFLNALKQTRVSLVAVDEAHCISQWGHDFRPDYLRIREFATTIQRPPLLALTATATPHVQTDIVTQLGLARVEKIVTGFNRPNLALRVRYTPNEAIKYRELEKVLREIPGSAIIYAGTRRDAEEIAEFCNEIAKIPATFYHAGLDDDERTRTQDAFMRGDIPLITATNAFGMGVDKPDIRAVIHFALPSTVEAYYQEIGRAGRDGEPARAILLYSPEDRALQEWFIENDAPESAQVQNLFRWLARAGLNWVSPTVLQRETGLNDTKLQLALRQLEIAGALKRLGDARGLLGLEVDAKAALDLTASVADNERRRKHRRNLLARMIEYAETNDCRRKFILDYFGDHGLPDAPDCCDNHAEAMLADANARPAESEEEWTPLVLLEIVRTLKFPVGRDKLAMIAKGSRAQEMQRAEYTKHRYYGKLADYTLAQLEEIVQELFRRGFLKTIGGEYPVTALSPQGAEALRKRIALDLNIPALPSQAKRDEKRATRQAGGTVERTYELAQKGWSPAEIARQRELTVGTIFDHLAQLIGEGTLALGAAVPPEIQEQIRAALQRAPGNSLTEVKLLLPETISYGEIRCVIAARDLLTRGPTTPKIKTDTSSHDSIEAFLARAHPKPLRGPWLAGFALDFHSKFTGAQHMRTELGETMYRFKYGNEPALGETIAARLAEFIRAHSDLARADILVPIPSTLKDRAYDPVPMLARLLAAKTKIAVNENALIKARATTPQKEMVNLAQKSANVSGAYHVAQPLAIRGKCVLLLDDFYDSGATLGEAARGLTAAGAREVCVLTVTKTIHAD